MLDLQWLGTTSQLAPGNEEKVFILTENNKHREGVLCKQASGCSSVNEQIRRANNP